MKTQLKQADAASQAMPSKVRAAHQAPMGQILQQYKDKTVQAQVMEEEDDLLQGKFITQRKEDDHALSENQTGLPDHLKSGIESLSGYSMDDVKVHYNSPKPAQLQALAYTQGTDIHVGSGQEKHLGHEAWHVVQQKQGRVQPTMQLQGVNVNDNTGLEAEADVMGQKILQLRKTVCQNKKDNRLNNWANSIQRKVTIEEKDIDDSIKVLVGLNQNITYLSWKKRIDVTHNFRTLEGLKKALEEAGEMISLENSENSENPLSFFCKENLKFITKDEDRLATLYFNNGTKTGRLRQQHPSGPLARMNKGKNIQLVFSNKRYRDLFKNDYKNECFKPITQATDQDEAKKKSVALVKSFENKKKSQCKKEGKLLEPRKSLFEITSDFGRTHPSGGEYQDGEEVLSKYNDNKIKEIYSEITGSTPEGRLTEPPSKEI